MLVKLLGSIARNIAVLGKTLLNFTPETRKRAEGEEDEQNNLLWLQTCAFRFLILYSFKVIEVIDNLDYLLGVDLALD